MDKDEFPMKKFLAIAAILILVDSAFLFGQSSGIKQATRCDTVKVNIFDLSFDPKDITVHPCDTVIWTNTDTGVTHSIKAISGSSDVYSKIASDDLNYHGVFQYTFNEKGKLVYTSKANTVLMQGTVTVE